MAHLEYDLPADVKMTEESTTTQDIVQRLMALPADADDMAAVDEIYLQSLIPTAADASKQFSGFSPLPPISPKSSKPPVGRHHSTAAESPRKSSLRIASTDADGRPERDASVILSTPSPTRFEKQIVTMAKEIQHWKQSCSDLQSQLDAQAQLTSKQEIVSKSIIAELLEQLRSLREDGLKKESAGTRMQEKLNSMLGTLKATEADLTTKAVDVSRIKDLLRSNEVEIQKWAIKYQQLDSKWNAKYTEDEKKWEQKYLHDWELWSVRLAEVQRQLNYQQECLVQSNEENRKLKRESRYAEQSRALAQRKCDEAMEESTKAKHDLACLDREVVRLRSVIMLKDEAIKNGERQEAVLQETLRKSEHQAAERLQERDVRLNVLQDELKTSEERLQKLQRLADEHLPELQRMEAKVQATQSHWQELERDYEDSVLQLQQREAQLAQEEAKLSEQRILLQHEEDKVAAENRRAQRKLEKADALSAQTASERSTLEDEVVHTHMRIVEAEDKIKQLEAVIRGLEESVSESQAQVQTLQERIVMQRAEQERERGTYNDAEYQWARALEVKDVQVKDLLSQIKAMEKDVAESHTKAQNALKTLEETQQTLRRTHNEREQTVRVKDQAIRDRDLAIERHLKQVVELELTIVQVQAQKAEEIKEMVGEMELQRQEMEAHLQLQRQDMIDQMQSQHEHMNNKLENQRKDMNESFREVGDQFRRRIGNSPMANYRTLERILCATVLPYWQFPERIVSLHQEVQSAVRDKEGADVLLCWLNTVAAKHSAFAGVPTFAHADPWVSGCLTALMVLFPAMFHPAAQGGKSPAFSSNVAEKVLALHRSLEAMGLGMPVTSKQLACDDCESHRIHITAALMERFCDPYTFCDESALHGPMPLSQYEDLHTPEEWDRLLQAMRANRVICSRLQVKIRNSVDTLMEDRKRSAVTSPFEYFNQVNAEAQAVVASMDAEMQTEVQEEPEPVPQDERREEEVPEEPGPEMQPQPQEEEERREEEHEDEGPDPNLAATDIQRCERGRQARKKAKALKQALESAPPWIGFVVKKKTGTSVFIEDVVKGGPADDAGLRDGDILLSVGGTDVEDMKTFWKAMKLHKKVFNKVPVIIERPKEGSFIKTPKGSFKGSPKADRISLTLTVGFKRKKKVIDAPNLRTTADIPGILADEVKLSSLIEATFLTLDDDNSGLVSAEEYAAFHKALSPELARLVSLQDLQAIWDEHDEGSSGYLKLREFAGVMKHLLVLLTERGQ